MYERLENLAAIIRDGWYGIERSKIFSSQFQTRGQWLAFIEERFGDPPNIGYLSSKWRESVGKSLCCSAFHALFIACWIFFPQEKGSFLIKLDDDIFDIATKSTRLLDTRVSSHLGKSGFSAAEDFDFLKGYHELLIQIEEGCLFLKAEGHPLKGFKNTVCHLAGWGKKIATGAGETANEYLHKVAKADTNHNVFVARAAENYSKNYEALLDFMKLNGKRITIRHATEKMYKMCQERATSPKYPGLREIWREKLGKIGLIPGLEISDILNMYPIEIINEKIATILTEVIIPFAKNLPPKSDFGKKVLAAERDIRSIANYLKTDFAPGGIRIFEEIRVTQEIIEEGLKRFKEILLSPPMNRT